MGEGNISIIYFVMFSDEIGKFKECARILHCFSVTLEVWNQWFYDIVEEAQRKILAKAGKFIINIRGQYIM